jgi:hypothetical protein
MPISGGSGQGRRRAQAGRGPGDKPPALPELSLTDLGSDRRRGQPGRDAAAQVPVPAHLSGLGEGRRAGRRISALPSSAVVGSILRSGRSLAAQAMR